MRLTTGRWSSLFACLAVALVTTAVLLSDRVNEQDFWNAYPGERPAATLAGRARSEAMQHAARVHLDASVLERWQLERQRDPSATLVLDRALPDSVSARYATLFEPLIDSLRGAFGDKQIAIFIHRDSSSAQPWAVDATGRPRNGSMAIDRYIIPPNASGDGRCVAVLSIGLASPPPHVVRNPLGPCMSVARYGAPGRGMLALLDTLGWKPPDAFVTQYSSSTATREMRREARTYLEPVALKCLTRSESCSTLWQLEFLRRHSQWGRILTGVPTVLRLPYATAPATDPAADDLAHWLAQLQRDVGEASFQSVWRGDVSLDDALQRQAGVTRSEWTRGWLAASFDVVPSTPAPSRGEFVWAVGMMVGFVVLGARGKAPRAR